MEDNDSSKSFVATFSMNLAQSFAISAAVTVGMLVGAMAVGYVVSVADDRRARKIRSV